MNITDFGTPVFCVLCFEEEPIESADALGEVMRSACDGVGCVKHVREDPNRADWGGPACTRCFLRELQEHAEEFNCAHARRLLSAATQARRKRADRIRKQWEQVCVAV